MYALDDFAYRIGACPSTSDIERPSPPEPRTGRVWEVWGQGGHCCGGKQQLGHAHTARVWGGGEWVECRQNWGREANSETLTLACPARHMHRTKRLTLQVLTRPPAVPSRPHPARHINHQLKRS
eukprot:61483-Chlamydomonas_euryale.AAC.2